MPDAILLVVFLPKSHLFVYVFDQISHRLSRLDSNDMYESEFSGIKGGSFLMAVASEKFCVFLVPLIYGFEAKLSLSLFWAAWYSCLIELLTELF